VFAAMVVLALSLTSGRPAFVAASVAGVPSVAIAAAAEENGTAIRPLRVNVPEADLAELRRRIAATRWPEKETVTDQSQGVPLATVRELALLGRRPAAARSPRHSPWPPDVRSVDRDPLPRTRHVDPQTSLSPRQRATVELKLLVIRGSLDDALERAIRQRESLK
jgi:hypothetical protein